MSSCDMTSFDVFLSYLKISPVLAQLHYPVLGVIQSIQFQNWHDSIPIEIVHDLTKDRFCESDVMLLNSSPPTNKVVPKGHSSGPISLNPSVKIPVCESKTRKTCGFEHQIRSRTFFHCGCCRRNICKQHQFLICPACYYQLRDRIDEMGYSS